MYNMEIYCTRPYCIENPYWTRRLWRLVQYGFSIQYRLVLLPRDVVRLVNIFNCLAYNWTAKYE